ncbi:MAG: PLP-dependent aminotransferase family protein [Cyanobacteria bacterium J06554_11]
MYEQIRTAILTGTLRSGQKIPASRQLAQSLGVSRSTVTQSYDQLISEGYLHTQTGSGTFVCAAIPDDLLTTEPLPRRARSQKIAQSTEQGISIGIGPGIGQEADLPCTPAMNPLPQLSAYAQRIHAIAPPTAQTKDSISFRYWRPDLSLFPTHQWQRLIKRHSQANTNWMTYSTTTQGHPQLREEIVTYISQARGVRCSHEQIVITQGTQQALGLIAQLLLNPNDTVAIEEPGYLSARKIFLSRAACLLPIPVDGEGMIIHAANGLIEQTNRQSAKLLYLTPSHQFPTGAVMSLQRRLAVLQWARDTHSFIVEDDYDSEFRYAGRPVPALQGLSSDSDSDSLSNAHVLYIGTFSKVMFPGLRLGYLVLPPALVPVFARAKWLCDRQCSWLHQAALADFIGQGHLSQHTRRMRAVYGRRRETLIQALQESCRDIGPTSIEGDPAGLHLVAQLPLAQLGVSDQQLAEQAKHQGVDLFSLRRYYLRPPENNDRFIFGFGGLDETEIREAIARIRTVLKSEPF